MTELSFHAEEIRENDVLLGRGGGTNNHIGNKHFRTIVADHQNEYLGARKKEKILIARRIVAFVHQNGGRFLKRGNNHAWEEVTDKRAQEKTSQALREGLDVRNKTIRLAKQPRRDSPDSSTDSPAPKRPNTSTCQPPLSPVAPSQVSIDGCGLDRPSLSLAEEGIYPAGQIPLFPSQFQRQLSGSEVTKKCAV